MAGHLNPQAACVVVFLDADTLPCGLAFEPAVAAQIDFRCHASTRPEDVSARIADAEVLIVNKVRLTRDVLRQASRLRCICIAAAGMDNVDLDAARELGIAVHNVPGYGSDSVAEHVIATLLALRRHLIDYSRAATDGRWSAAGQFCWHGPRILPMAGSTLGIVGRGAIGRATAQLAEGLGLRVLYAQRPGRAMAEDERPLDDLLAECDAVSLHVPLSPETRGMMDARRLALMQPHAILINTGRGALVDPLALAHALRAQQLAGAAIDVLEVEPPAPGHPLLAPDIPNLLLTPHVAWASDTAQQRLASRLVALVGAHVAQRA